MKILIITLIDQGGMVHYTSQLANSLSCYGDVTVITGKVNKSILTDECDCKINSLTICWNNW